MRLDVMLLLALWCVPHAQGVPAMALSLADHGAKQQQHYDTPATLAVPLIQVGRCNLVLCRFTLKSSKKLD